MTTEPTRGILAAIPLGSGKRTREARFMFCIAGIDTGRTFVASGTGVHPGLGEPGVHPGLGELVVDPDLGKLLG